MHSCVFFGLCVTLHVLLAVIGVACMVVTPLILHTTSLVDHEYQEDVLRVLGEGTPELFMICGAVAVLVVLVSAFSNLRIHSSHKVIYVLIYIIAALAIFAIVLDIAFLVKYSNSVKPNGERYFTEMVQNYGKNEETSRKVDGAQIKFTCCGVYSVREYRAEATPYSCCGMPDWKTNHTQTVAYTYNRLTMKGRSDPACDGCFDKIWIYAYQYVIAAYLIIALKIALEFYVGSKSCWHLVLQYRKPRNSENSGNSEATPDGSTKG